MQRTILVMLVAILANGIAAPSWAGDWEDCKGASDPNRRISACSQVINRRVGNHSFQAIAHGLRADAFGKINKYDQAVADYIRAVELETIPERATIFKNALKSADHMMGLSLRVQGDNQGAITIFNKAILFDPQDAKAFQLRGQAYVAIGNKAQGINDYT